MNNFKKKYKILAIGDIQLQAIKNERAEKKFAQNYDVIEEIWQRLLKEKGEKLFNGTLLNFVKVIRKGSKIKVAAHFFEYKNYLAQNRRPDLKLGIRLVGVSGIMVLNEYSKDYIVFAKRTNNVTEYPGFFELVPSGSIDREHVDVNGIVDFRSQLLSEFVEETGLPRDNVKDITSFAFVLDTNHNIYDVCCKILLKTTKESIIREFLGSDEYSNFVLVAIDDLDWFVKENFDSIVPTSIAIIEAYGRII